MADDESRIITLDDARAKRAPKSRMQDYCTREEMITSATTAALGVGQKMYDEIAAEHAEQFAKLEHVLWQKMLAELEARSLRVKLRRLWSRIRPVAPNSGFIGAVTNITYDNAQEELPRFAAMTPEEYAPKAP